MKKLFFIIFILCFFIGCATQPIIYVDGVKIPHSTYNSVNLQTNIKIEILLFNKNKRKNDNNDFYIENNYLEVGETYNIYDFKNVNILVKITNPDRHTYQVKSKYLCENKEIVAGGYISNLSNNVYSASFKKLKGKYSVYLIIEKIKDNKVETEIFNVNIVNVR